ncbi:hypothetical protein [Streptomyces sp. NPDC053427]|uniref:hypothetical protein n=1 Tax=Streptomyces sp. NPDC053427 TaxID=3365701 RepID=UPI0037CF2D58
MKIFEAQLQQGSARLGGVAVAAVIGVDDIADAALAVFGAGPAGVAADLGQPLVGVDRLEVVGTDRTVSVRRGSAAAADLSGTPLLR